MSGRGPDIAGERFHRLLVLRLSPQRLYGLRTWECRCDCGRVVLARTGALRAGAVKSCGCLTVDKSRARRTTHGGSYRPEYQVWHGHVSRARHGGPPMCEAWQSSFARFLADVGPRPSPESRLRRFNLERGFSPSNCTWFPKQSNVTTSRVVRVRRHERRAAP